MLHCLALLPLLCVEHYINVYGVACLAQVVADAAPKHVAKQASTMHESVKCE
jgi:hypothetical protein